MYEEFVQALFDFNYLDGGGASLTKLKRMSIISLW